MLEFMFLKKIFSIISKKKTFSFEDFLVSKISSENWNFFITKSFFLDIGIKKDYLISKRKLKKYE